MISRIETIATPLPITPIPAIKASAVPESDTTAEVSAPASDSSHISILARQLSESAARAEARDQSLTRSQLGHLGFRLRAQFDTVSYFRPDAMQVLPDATINDPALKQRDRQAVEYVIRTMHCDPTARNPFAGLSYEQLTVIAYDEGDAFTLHERHAAYLGAWEVELGWRASMGNRSQQGAFTQELDVFYAEHLAHYRSLPLIEQARYPEDYEADTEALMIEAAAAAPKKGERLLTLFEILAGAIPGKDNKAEEKPPKEAQTPAVTAPAIKTNN
ncbi:hypothetical protein AAIM60_16635 [Pseudomonas lijiangensis]|uniref:hypothetical protein n=1 Tax=Pseudomonas syringae group TaxID=136849 RepID=UPI0018E6200D|nr:hypothetical protein [Pseudomonas cichorii]MBI6851780.1 hypothetical protein [Pseudomonas cichorii]